MNLIFIDESFLLNFRQSFTFGYMVMSLSSEKGLSSEIDDRVKIPFFYTQRRRAEYYPHFYTVSAEDTRFLARPEEKETSQARTTSASYLRR